MSEARSYISAFICFVQPRPIDVKCEKARRWNMDAKHKVLPNVPLGLGEIIECETVKVLHNNLSVAAYAMVILKRHSIKSTFRDKSSVGGPSCTSQEMM